MSGRAGWIQRSRRYGVERGDTGLGRDAYGPPRHERDRHGYGPEPYPSDDGYPVEDDDAAGPGRRAEDEDDFGQLLRRPGEMPPRQAADPPAGTATAGRAAAGRASAWSGRSLEGRSLAFSRRVRLRTGALATPGCPAEGRAAEDRAVGT